MKIREGFILRKMGGQAVVVSVGEASKVFNGMIKLNETGEFLWQSMNDDVSESELVRNLIERYDVDEEIAKEDVKSFIDILKKPGIIE